MLVLDDLDTELGELFRVRSIGVESETGDGADLFLEAVILEDVLCNGEAGIAVNGGDADVAMRYLVEEQAREILRKKQSCEV